MARQLPFDVAPTQRYHQIGDEERGILKLRQRGGISIAERMAVIEIDRSEELFKELADFCVAVHRDAKEPSVLAGKELHEIYMATAGVLDLMQSGGNPAMKPLEAELALTYTEQLQAMHRKRIANSEEVIVRQATTMIQNRIANCRDWTDEDTKELDSEQLIVKIALFYREEASGGATAAAANAAQEAVKQMEELKAALGKLQTARGSQSANPTGQGSTGDAETPTQDAESLSPTTSELSPSTTCAMPSTPPQKGKGNASTEKS